MLRRRGSSAERNKKEKNARHFYLNMITSNVMTANYSFIFSLALAAFHFASLPSTAQETTRELVVREATPTVIETILKEVGIEYVELGDKAYKCIMADLTFFVYNQKSELRLYAAFPGGTDSLGRINDWNKKNLFSRAYLNGDHVPIIESELDFLGGVTDATVARFLGAFKLSANAFKQYVQN
jgi:hypothetical protein